MLRVIIADDHHLVRQGIRALLEQEDEIEVIAEAANGLEVVAQVEELKPDVVVLDISMPQLDGIQATAQISNLDLATQVIVLSMHSKPNIVQQALRQGAKGYLLKDSISAELILAIQAAARNETYLSPSISGQLLEDLWTLQKENDQAEISDLLTPREKQVLQLISEGHTNKEIAEILTISDKTVSKHRTNLMFKLDVHDVPSLMRKAIEQNLIFLDSK